MNMSVPKKVSSTTIGYLPKPKKLSIEVEEENSFLLHFNLDTVKL